MHKALFFIYFIGLSGSGKSTISSKLASLLRKKYNVQLQVLDGDEIRNRLEGMFGYSYAERMKTNRVARVVAQYLLENNISVLLSQVGAYKMMRDSTRQQFKEYYIEVYVKCSLSECARRDTKGYYKAFREGRLENFNGGDEIFEVPQNSDIVVDTEQEDIESAVMKIEKYLIDRGYLRVQDCFLYSESGNC